MAEVEISSSLDTHRLSSFLDIDVPDLQSVVDSANEGFIFVLQQVLVKAQEYEEISNAKAILEIDYGMIDLKKTRLTGRTSGSYIKCQSDKYEGTASEISR